MVSFTSILLAITVAAAFYYFSSKGRSKSPPGPIGLPIIGSLLSVGKRPHLTFQKWARKYGPIVQTKLGFTRVLLLDDIKLIREAYADTVFSGRPDNKLFNLLAGGKHGVISSEGQEWVEQRRFALRNLRDFGFGKSSMETLINDEVSDVISWMKKNEGKPLSVNKKFSLAVLNALWMIMAGERYDHDDTEHNSILDELNDIFNKEIAEKGYLLFFPQLSSIIPELSGWNKLQRAVKPLINVFNKAVAEHEEKPADPNNPRDFIDIYLNEIQNTSDPKSSFHGDAGRHSLVTVLGDLYGAGSGTTSVTLSWSILYLMTHPRVQHKLQSEIDSVIGKSRIPALADRPKTPYAEAVILEILRFSSLVPFGVFHNTMQDTTFHGFDVKKDTLVIANHYSVHFNVETWGDPEVFKPERFLTADGTTVQRRDALMPFSVGRRQCLGESLARDQLYLFIMSIFQRFQVLPDPASPNPSLEPDVSFLREPQPFTVIFKDRI